MTDEPSPDSFVINIPEPYLVAMGKVGVVWGIIEQVVDLAIGRLAGFGTYDPRAAIVTAHMTWPLKMDVLEALADQLAPQLPRLAQYNTVKPLLKKAQDARNQVAHGHWVYRDGKVYRLRATARGKLRANIQPVALAEIESAINHISAAGRAVLKIVFDA